MIILYFIVFYIVKGRGLKQTWAVESGRICRDTMIDNYEKAIPCTMMNDINAISTRSKTLNYTHNFTTDKAIYHIEKKRYKMSHTLHYT